LYCPQQYFSKWGQEGVVDLKEEFSRLIALTAARTLLGREIREQLFDQVRGKWVKL
jgi:sterol 14-demethylase